MPFIDHRSDEELMSLFCATLDEAVFRVLMERHHGMALSYIRKKVFCRQLAEDIVQDSFLKVVRNRDSFNPSKKFAAWFYSILKNTAIDALRQRQRYQNKLKKFAAHVNLSRQRPGRKSYPVEHLLCMVQKEDRALLVDHFICGMTFVELAEKHGHSKEALKKRAQRAIRKIRTSISMHSMKDDGSFSFESLLT